MRQMNVISRCASAYKTEHGRFDEISGCHHVFFYPICKTPGLSQDALVKHTRLNKSTVTRALAYLEEHGFVVRRQDEEDKRSMLVYPTEKMLDAFPKVKELAADWNGMLAEGISDHELEVFRSVLAKMHDKAVMLAFGDDTEANEK